MKKKTDKYLRSLYKRHIKFDKHHFFINCRKYSDTLEGIKLSDKILGKFYNNYYKASFLTFLSDIKTIVYSKDVFGFIREHFSEDWDLLRYLKFLEKEKVIKLHRNGRASLLRKDIKEVIPKPQTSQEIKRKVERKLKIRVKEEEPVINLFKKFQKFTVKTKWDQMPISAGSAFFVAERILKHLPIKGKFLLIGDDDFISVILTLVDPEIEVFVIDADEELLSCINNLSLKFNLKIETKKVDIRKEKDLGEKFVGFLCNPIYTEDGVKEFVKFGKNQLGKDGGLGFLEVGDESIGNRFLFLQDFFTKNNLVITEMIPNRIYYPYIVLWEKEDKVMAKMLSARFNKKTIKRSPKIGAALYVFEYLPQRPKRVKFKTPIYAYL